jgi:hypothetical protein
MPEAAILAMTYSRFAGARTFTHVPTEFLEKGPQIPLVNAERNDVNTLLRYRRDEALPS